MDTTTDRRGRRFRANLVALGAAAGMTLAGFGMAAAQTDDAPAGPPPAEERPMRMHKRGGGPGGGDMGMGMGMGMKGALHGEFVTRAPDGEGFQTLATQHGEVTEVSGSSLTVKSEDGFSRTYAVTDDTLVNAGDDGIADVEQGDRVAVVARVADGKATAVEVRDATKVRELRRKWAPGRARQPSEPAPES